MPGKKKELHTLHCIQNLIQKIILNVILLNYKTSGRKYRGKSLQPSIRQKIQHWNHNPQMEKLRN